MRKKCLLITIIGIIVLIQSMNANTWSSTKRLTWTSGFSWYPVVATDSSNNIHVVWTDQTPGNWEIYYKKSTDKGTSWTTKRLTYTWRVSQKPAIAVDTSDNIHVAWADNTPGNKEIYYKKSTNGGTSWTTKRLTYNSGSSDEPAIAVDSSNNVFVIWQDDTPGNDEIYYKKSMDGGMTWGGTKRLTWNSGTSEAPAIAVDSYKHIHVVWEDDTQGNDEIYSTRSTNGGVTWTNKRLTYTSGDSWNPTIAIDSSESIHVAWTDHTPGNWEIYYKKSTNGGTSWTTKRLTWNSGSSNDPAIGIDAGNNIHVIWCDDNPGNYEIYHRRSIDGGMSWPGAKRLTWNSGVADYPNVAIDSNDTIHLVWYEATSGSSEIYYKNGEE
jgi:hypothetical protein